MIDFSIAVLPFIIIGVANFVVSWLYYSPLAPWFKTWQIGVGADLDRKEMTEEEKKAMPRLMGGAVVASFLLSYGLQVIIHSVNARDFISGATIGFVLWFGFAVTHSLNTQFEGRKPIVLVINNVLYMLTYSAFGGIIAILS
jgi:UDP-N-acetylmuramyl pentapeptide phosphotransferase/UDP-N-acetylglucosamine-1-phosphate transferase